MTAGTVRMSQPVRTVRKDVAFPEDERGAKQTPLEKPIRIWTGGPGSPQEKIVIPGSSKGIKPRVDGSYLLTTKEQVEAAKKALGNRFWRDDVPEDEESPRCTTCNWTSRSMRAMFWHLNNAHGREQRTH